MWMGCCARLCSGSNRQMATSMGAAVLLLGFNLFCYRVDMARAYQLTLDMKQRWAEILNTL